MAYSDFFMSYWILEVVMKLLPVLNCFYLLHDTWLKVKLCN